MSNRTYATCLQYRADEHAKTCIPGMTTDIFDGLHYHALLGKHVVVGDQRLAHHYFSDDMTSHSASPLTASLPSKSGSILHGSSLSSIIISLQTNTSRRTTSFVLGSYLVQRSHMMQTCSSILLCKNSSSFQPVCLHMMPSLAVSLPSMLILSLPLVTFLPFPCLCT